MSFIHVRCANCLALATVLCASSLSAQQTTQGEDARYVASSRGRVFYWTGCEAWKRLSPKNLLYFSTPAEAAAAGYRPSQSRGCAPQLDTAPVEPTIGGRAPCTVARIIDGDTFACEGGSRVRLLIVDTDEVGQSVYADSAVILVRRLMPPGARVRLEFDVELFDRYGRVLAYVFADSVFVNREIVRRGMGQIAVYPPNVRMVEVLRAAADSARHEKLGLWAGSAFACTPAEFRARTCR